MTGETKEFKVRFNKPESKMIQRACEISLELGNKCPESIKRGNSVSNLRCVKGANGSGKTNVLKILGFLKFFCCNSFNNKPEAGINIASFFMNDKPIDLFCHFLLNDIQYQYELSLTSEIVFLDIQAEHYGAGLGLLDFINAPEPSRIVINDWVSDETEERRGEEKIKRSDPLWKHLQRYAPGADQRNLLQCGVEQLL